MVMYYLLVKEILGQHQHPPIAIGCKAARSLHYEVSYRLLTLVANFKQ
jgi:hypothetical protein